MKDVKFKFLRDCESIVFENSYFLIDGFLSAVGVKFNESSNNLDWLCMRFMNSSNNRAVEVIISEGINANGEQSYSITFTIQKTDENNETVSSFSILDFCRKKKLAFFVESFFTGSAVMAEVSEFFKASNEILQSNEMKNVLLSDNWVDIKPNYFPYK